MTNAFSPNYRPVIDMADQSTSRKISETRTRQRREGMASTDEATRKVATGTLPGAPLSKRGGRKV